MGFFNNFPYTNFHDMNLDYLLAKIHELEKSLSEYMAINRVAYGGIWDIRKGYPRWTVVTNGDKAYIATEPVPVGVAIDNTKYWMELIDLDPRISGILETLNNVHIVNVLNYGAKGDCVSDDTAAVQEALDDAYTTGCIVFFPAGVYMVSGVTVKSTVSIIGEGQDSTTLRLIRGNNGKAVITSANFEKLTGTNDNGGVSGVAVRDMTIDANGVTGSYGLRKYGYRWNICNVVFCNAGEAGIYTEWGTNPGAPNDGKYMEDVFYNIRCHHNKDGFIYNGAHDALFDSILLYLNHRYGFICNVSGVYSGAGAFMTKVHAYANGSDGIVLNAQTVIDGLISESNNAQESPGAVGGCGVVVNANNCLLTNLYCYTNTEAAAVKLNASYCTIKGTLPANKTGIEIEADGGTNNIDVSIYTNQGQTAIANTERISHTSIWKAVCTGSDFKIVQSGFDLPTIAVPLPGGIGAENKYTNNTLTPLIGYQYGGEKVHTVDCNGVDTELGNVDTFVLLPGNSVYFTIVAPQYWRFKPFTI